MQVLGEAALTRGVSSQQQVNSKGGEGWMVEEEGGLEASTTPT